MCVPVGATFFLLTLGEPPSAPADADWPIFRGNARLTGVATSDLPAKPVVRWRFEAGDVIESSAAIAGGVAYVGCDNGSLFALDLATGKPRWKYESKSAIKSSPSVHGDLVYFGDEDGIFHALDHRSGSEKWHFKTGGEIVSAANCIADRLVFGSYDGSLYCLSTKDGRQLWKADTEDKLHGTPAVADDVVLASGCDAKMHVVRLSDGSPVRSIPLASPSAASAATLGDRVFVGTMGNQVLGLDWKSGKRLWQYENPDRQFPFFSSAAVTEKCVVIGGRDKSAHALNPATGKALWTFPTQGKIDASPVIVGDRVFVASTDGRLYALSLDSGKESWRFDAGSGFYATPAVGEGFLVIGTEDGAVYCFGAAAGN